MLYYPHYTPSKERLRATLLFCNELSLIVPGIDQHGVSNRTHINELLQHNDQLISYKDPTNRYDRWMRHRGVKEACQNLIEGVVQEIADEGELAPIRVNRGGVVEPGQDDEIAYRWTAKGWKYVAAEKFPSGFKDIFFRDGVALKVGHFRHPNTNEIIEHNGVLCHPKLADFVLSRMAREASIIEGIPSITFGGIHYTDHLYDATTPTERNKFRLLQSTMDLLVPDNLAAMDSHDFLRIRDEFAGVRRDIWSFLDDISREQNLDILPADHEAVMDRLTAARNAVSNELDVVRRQIGKDRFISSTLFSFEAAATIGFAAAGAIAGGPLGAAVAAGSGFALMSGARKLSTLGTSGSGQAKSIAMSIAKLEKRGVPKRRATPNYWL